MQIGVLTENAPFERRVALTPESAGRLIAAGHSVYVQSGAGEASAEEDDAYRAAGAMIAKSPEEILGNIDLLTTVGQLDQQTAAKLRPGTAVIGLSSPRTAAARPASWSTGTPATSRWSCSRVSPARSPWTPCPPRRWWPATAPG